MQRETGMYDSSQIPKHIQAPIVIILFQNNLLIQKNMPQINEIHFHFPMMFPDKPKNNFSCFYKHFIPSELTMTCICNISYN